MSTHMKEFKPTSWSIDNKISIYVLTFIIAIFGAISYLSIPKEQFPEIVIPQIIVSTVYSGTSPSDMENLVTRPLEKNIKSISGVKKITSKSIQDFSLIIVEFNTGIEIEDAKRKVSDEVDKTKNDLPNDLTVEPQVMEIDLSQIPIRYINIAGNYDLSKLKEYAEIMQDRIESLPEITRVDIVGALDREIQVDVDMYKMQASSVTFGQIESALMYENMTIAAGNIELDGMSRSIRIVGEFDNMEQIRNIVITSSSGALVFLKDIANIQDSYKEQESFSRFNGKNVITLNVVKKSGQNLLEASEKIDNIITNLKTSKFPKDLEVSITGDQSKHTKSILKELNNMIIIGFILVAIVLMFFMGLTNALFVALSVPLSMALSYILLPGIDFTMNMLVMFSFIFALGIVVDDAIVVIENTHRIFKQYGFDIKKSAKIAAGEVFVPILSGTLTTLAPFFPLAFWPGVVGSFMFFIPVTIIVALFMSLIVAYIINPVFAVDFMKHDDDHEVMLHQKKVYRYGAIIVGLGLLFYAFSGFTMGTTTFGIGTFILFIGVYYMFHNLYGVKLIKKFQHGFLPKMMRGYDKVLQWAIRGKNPYRLLWGTFGLLIFTFIITGLFGPKVVFFPDNDPTNIYVFAKLPVGTDVKVTDSVTRLMEERVKKVFGENNPDVESIVVNVALGASSDPFDGGTVTANKAKIAINLLEYEKRIMKKTVPIMDSLRVAMSDIAGAEITVEKENMGPPTGKPVNIELSSEDLDELISVSDQYVSYLDSINIPGVEKFKTDFEKSKPEIVIDIDRQRANYEGISTAQIAMEIRTAILGKEASKYREGEDQYPIQLRYAPEQRKSIDKLMNLDITYRDMNTGMLRQIPLSAIATVKYQNSPGGINRKDLKRVITVNTNVTSGYTANEIVAKVRETLPKFPKPETVDIKITGEQEDQAESSSFLGTAMLLSLFLILFILITQFNSLTKPLIILTEVIFSIIGVLLGFTIFGMPISIIMTGMGIVALAGIVVRNGILLVEFTDVLKERGLKTRNAIIEAGKTRITPVILTATAAMLGLFPLAMGFNINFGTLFTEFNPQIHFGGDNADFFGPLAWTIIFGLIFATFLTLILIPAMYFISYSGEVKYSRFKHKRKIETIKELEEDELNEY